MKKQLTDDFLLQAFDLCRFTESPRLQAVIDNVHARTAAQALSDDELEFVAAAGEQSSLYQPKEPRT